jgi:hypothetical protein
MSSISKSVKNVLAPHKKSEKKQKKKKQREGGGEKEREMCFSLFLTTFWWLSCV